MRSTLALQTAAAALSALAALLTPVTAHAASPGDAVALPVRDALAALPIQQEDRTGYERTKPSPNSGRCLSRLRSSRSET
ncbi:hypothetical protein OOK36_54485 [Streptomyces sp. NBC_00365]|uniref:hypothetical protein n=1 Tax=Streptomyces sp. NBC_00365 TaxID=2975726 RepID=UPI00225334BA|nr:hypothetical protein [Streptomyces sp. NBC_00365]MCX5097483.1 hypothetical protein [Streptomyces sp. NBC_00365]